MPTLDEILAPRRTGKFYLGEDEPIGTKLARILPDLGLTPEQVGEVVERLYAEREQQGPAFVLQRVTKTENDKLRGLAKIAKPERLDKPTGKWLPEEKDQEDYLALRLAHAIVEPEVPGTDLRSKADYLLENLTTSEIGELSSASFALDSFNLEKAQERVKN